MRFFRNSTVLALFALVCLAPNVYGASDKILIETICCSFLGRRNQLAEAVTSSTEEVSCITLCSVR
jgi:hypothetical protein